MVTSSKIAIITVLLLSRKFAATGELTNPRFVDVGGELADHNECRPEGGSKTTLLLLEDRCAINEDQFFCEGCRAGGDLGEETSGTTSNLTTSGRNVAFACEDYHDHCDHWARSGFCYKSQEYMHEECPLSCNVCQGEDEDGPLPSWHYGLGEDLGVPQELDFEGDEVGKEALLWVIEQARVYLKEHEQKLYGTDLCTNQHPMCAFWALTNECQNDREYMLEFCAPMCGDCDDILEGEESEGEDEVDEDEDEDFDCFEGLVDAWKPGDIEKTFQRLTSEPFSSLYQVEILSSPETTAGPWIVTIDGAFSADETQLLIDAGYDIGFDRSGNGGSGPRISSKRTSSTAWCSQDCMQDPKIREIMDRLADFAGIPSTNAEDLQILKYRKGEKYDVHHDMNPDESFAPHGPRVLTLYIYLNDVPAGGGTWFDKLGITVQPKQAKLVLWPSVLDSDVRQMDDRTTHSALPVERGAKYGTNVWFHLSDYKTVVANGCFDDY